MSSLVYGQLRDTNRTSSVEFRASTKKPFTLKNIVSQVSDAILVLVPAEAVVLHTVMLQFATKTESLGLTVVTSIKDSSLLVWSFPAIIVVTVLLYMIGVFSSTRPKWTLTDYFRMFLGGLAYTSWILFAKVSFFTVAFPTLLEGPRTFLAVAIALIIIALHGFWEGKR